MRLAFNLTIWVMVTLAVSACVDDPHSGRTAFDNSGGNLSGAFGLGERSNDGSDGENGEYRRDGSGRFYDEESLRITRQVRANVVQLGGGKVEVNIVNASIQAAAKAVLGDALGEPYVIADGLEGRITLQTTVEVEKTYLLELFTKALEINGIAIQRDAGVFNITSTNEARRAIRSSSSPSASLGANPIVVAPVKYVSAESMSKYLKEIVGGELGVLVDDSRNILLLSGGSSEITVALEVLNLFDVDILEGKSTSLIRLDSAEPVAISEELKVIFDSDTGGALHGVIEFLPNPRLKSILIVSTQVKYIGEAERWVRDLDRSAGSARRYTETYPLQNRSAESLAPLLARVLGVSTQVASDSGAGSGGASETPQATGALQIIADNDRNTIIARAFRKEHEEILRVIGDLDSTSSQLLLEATIAEVTLNDELSLGVRWFFESASLSTTFSNLTSGAVAAVYPGFSTVFSNGNDRVALSALASITDVKVVSSPSITVLNNQEAQLRIGDQVPVATRNTQSTDDPNAPVVTSIEYRDTGVILTIKPRISQSGQVVLNIEQEVSDVVETTTSGIDSPTIRQRSVRTSVVVADGETLALGGIIQERDTKTNTRVPLLGDIPIIGAAFRSQRDDIKRTELLILIRPRVIRNSEDARRVTEYWRAKLGGPDQLLREGVPLRRHSLDGLFD